MKKGISGTYIVFSDVQGSFNYLERFFKATKNMKKDNYICLGDIVQELATFPDNRCIEKVRENTEYCVRGNHENRITKDSKQKIQLENLIYIEKLPTIKDLGNVLIFHSSVKQEGIRLLDKKQMLEEWEHIKKNYPDVKYALFGHSHKKGAYTARHEKMQAYEGEELQLNPNELNMINPGGIGLQHGMEKTFARINLNNGKLKFFTLEEAEEMAQRADMINEIYDQIPSLKGKDKEELYNPETNIKKLQALITKGERKDKILEQFAKKLESFYTTYVNNGSTQNKPNPSKNTNILTEIDIANEPMKKYYNTPSLATQKKH